MQLPIDKADVATADFLASLPPEAIRPHIPALLEWLQDMNWPVARPIAAVLAKCGLDLVEPIRAILQGDDSVWKYWMASLLCDVEPNVRIALEDDIIRICEHPTAAEIVDEVHLAMRDVFLLMAYGDGAGAPAAS